jgi:hypothetical protein
MSAVVASCITLAVEESTNAQPLRIRHAGRRHKRRADGTERVERLPAHPLAVPELEVARGDVVDAGVSPDGAALAHHDAELGLEVDLGADRRQENRLRCPDQRVRPLRKQQRVRRRLDGLLCRVGAVVEPDADDLLRERPAEQIDPEGRELGARGEWSDRALESWHLDRGVRA